MYKELLKRIGNFLLLKLTEIGVVLGILAVGTGLLLLIVNSVICVWIFSITCGIVVLVALFIWFRYNWKLTKEDKPFKKLLEDI